MILVDTSIWIDFFEGSEPIAEQIDRALLDDEVATCGPVQTELHRGLRSKEERSHVLVLLEGCHWLEQPDDLWREAGEIEYFLGRKGATVKTLDLLIATYALAYSTPIFTKDKDFKLIQKSGIAIQLLG